MNAKMVIKLAGEIRKGEYIQRDECGIVELLLVEDVTTFRNNAGTEMVEIFTGKRLIIVQAQALVPVVERVEYRKVGLPSDVQDALIAAWNALVELDACDDPNCKEPNCNHAITKIKKALTAERTE